jgi:hypothetical protein
VQADRPALGPVDEGGQEPVVRLHAEAIEETACLDAIEGEVAIAQFPARVAQAQPVEPERRAGPRREQQVEPAEAALDGELQPLLGHGADQMEVVDDQRERRVETVCVGEEGLEGVGIDRLVEGEQIETVLPEAGPDGTHRLDQGAQEPSGVGIGDVGLDPAHGPGRSLGGPLREERALARSGDADHDHHGDLEDVVEPTEQPGSFDVALGHAGRRELGCREPTRPGTCHTVTVSARSRHPGGVMTVSRHRRENPSGATPSRRKDDRGP